MGGEWRLEVRRQLGLALPVAFVQLGLMAMGAVDGMFLGRVDATQYAASAIGHTYTFLFLIFGMGLLSVLDPIVSQAHGAHDEQAIARGVQRGVLLALGLSLPIAACQWPAASVLGLLGQPPAVVEVAGPYARVLMLSTPAFLVFVALRQTLQGMHVLRPLVVTIVLANALNAFLDWVLIDGHLGAPAMGALGSAWGTLISRCAMVAMLVVASRERLLTFLFRRVERLFDIRALGRMLVLGFSPGVQWFAELGAFAGIMALMGALGEVELAGHQVTMHLASGSFMIPLGLSMATSIRVGNEIGRGSVEGARRAARVGVVSGIAIMLLFGALFLTLPGPLARVFTDLPDVLDVAIVLIPMAGLFQVFDGTQVVAVGALRGMGDMRVPMLFHLAGFWGVALPLGAWLSLGRGLGPTGPWWGLTVGLGCVAVLQFLRLRVMLRREISRIVIDHGPSDGARVR